MLKIFRFYFFDLIRSRWTVLYALFYLLLTSALLLLSPNLSKVIISLMNIVLFLVPLIASMLGIMYFYSSRDFIELLLAQPLRRSTIFFGQYLSIVGSLGLSLLLGIGIPFLLYGILSSAEIWNYLVLLGTGLMLTFIFSGIAFWIALKHENRIKGFGLMILCWLFFAVIYDGLFLLGLSWFNDYPLEKFALGASLFNPIDLSRILILLKLDIAALMGFTGAVFSKFLGSGLGMLISMASLLLWVGFPIWRIRAISLKKDF
ncbi:MAG: ABC transporter permease [Saprospiraceae bacterium]|nr:ABC transporter permease [Saprospiraceae bacterium]